MKATEDFVVPFRSGYKGVEPLPQRELGPDRRHFTHPKTAVVTGGGCVRIWRSLKLMFYTETLGFPLQEETRNPTNLDPFSSLARAPSLYNERSIGSEGVKNPT